MVTIRVSGLEAMIRGTKAIAPDLGKRVREANLKFAQQLVPLVHRRYQEYFPRPWSTRPSTGRTLRGIRATAGQGRSSIVIGGARYPYLPGQEFGSGSAKMAFTRLADVFGVAIPKSARSEATRYYAQFAPYTARQGRFLFPVIREAIPSMVEEYHRLLDEALAEAFPESGAEDWGAQTVERLGRAGTFTFAGVR